MGKIAFAVFVTSLVNIAWAGDVRLPSGGISPTSEATAGQRTTPIEQAITFRLGQCDVQALMLGEQITQLKSQLEEANKRADDAEAKVTRPGATNVPH